MTLYYETADDALQGICSGLSIFGRTVGSRQGELIKEYNNATFTIAKPKLREIVNRSRKASIAAQIAETMWVLAGRNDVEWLSNYLPRAADFSDDGEIWRGAYGPRLRAYGSHREESVMTYATTAGTEYLDQLQYVYEVLRTDPESRRAVISLYDPQFDCGGEKDIPCNNWLDFTIRNGCLNLLVGIRSNDVIWGWSGVNQFEWSALQEILANLLGVQVGRTTYAVGSQHIYEKHWGRAARIGDEDLTDALDLTPTPSFSLGAAFEFRLNDKVAALDALIRSWFEIEEAIRTQFDREVVWYRDVVDFPEPMLKAWLHVIAAYWTGDTSYLTPGSRLAAAFAASPPRKVVGTTPEEKAPALKVFAVSPDVLRGFYKETLELHETKARAYGNSWRRRGEVFGIMPNIARKVDRLGVDNDDETELDTARDLFLYLAKYKVWLAATEDQRKSEDVEWEIDAVAKLNDAAVYASAVSPADFSVTIERIRSQFEQLERTFETSDELEARRKLVDGLVSLSSSYALGLYNAWQDAWLAEQTARARARAWL